MIIIHSRINLKFVTFLMLQVLYSSVFGQGQNNLLGSLIATEYAFAASAADIGTHDAFLAYIADDGILFRPNPVNGKEYLKDAGSSNGILSWYPTYATVSRKGDFGFTTGPWELKEKKSNNTLYGNYCTVWEKKTDGDWEFVIDFGTKNDKPQIIPARLKSSLNYSANPINNVINKKVDQVELLELDKQLNSNTSAKYLSSESRFLRDGFFPIIGSQNITAYITRNEIFCCFKPAGGKISLSKDFGFTYGVRENSDPKKNSKEQFNYVNVWKKEGNKWILLSDVIKKIGK